MILKKWFSLICVMVVFMSVDCVYAGTLTSDEYSQKYHYNVRQGFMNDIQTIWKDKDGTYHLYYLADDNYKHEGDGTEWAHVTTTDFIDYDYKGIAIEKFNGVWEAVATGSIIDNSNYFYKDLPSTALISYFTSYTPDGQKQFCAYSTDNGYTFKPYQADPVMIPSSKFNDFRDPYVFYDENKEALVMYLAEGDKVGVYESRNGKQFNYVGATLFNREALSGESLGTIECPNLKVMFDEVTNTNKYVMFFGANGYNYGQTTGTYYMVGYLNENNIFIPEQRPKRLDNGTDYYAANFLKTEDNKNLKSLGWIGNWGYSGSVITDSVGERSYKLGSISMPRNLNLAYLNGEYVIKTSLVKPYNKFSNNISGLGSTTYKRDGNLFNLLDINRLTNQNIYLQFSDIEKKQLEGDIFIKFIQEDNIVTLKYNADTGLYNIGRVSKNIKDGESNNNYERIYSVESGIINPDFLKLHIYSDQSSIEIEFENSNETYTLLKYSMDKNMRIVVDSSNKVILNYSANNIEN